MKPTRRLSRRSFLVRVAGGAVAAGAAMTTLTGPARAQGCSDSDGGNNADPAGRGRRCRTGQTDGDSGNHSDPGGNGRCPRRSRASGVTDGDSGSYADRANFGRGRARN